MVTYEVRYRRRSETFSLPGSLTIAPEYWAPVIFGPLALLGPVPVSSVLRALRSYIAHQGLVDGPNSIDFDGYEPIANIGWTLDDPERFHIEESIYEPTELGITGAGDVLLAVILDIESEGDWSERWPELEAIYRQWCEPRSLDLRGLQPVVAGREFIWRAVFAYRCRGLNIRDVAEMGNEIRGIARSVVDGYLSPSEVAALLDRGLCRALVGLPETSTLEAKRALELTSPNAALDFASDVAAFCNSSSAGLLVIGLATKSQHGEDIIHSIHPVHSGLTSRRIGNLLRRFVYPPIDGLVIRRVPTNPTGGPNDMLLYVYIPAQQDSLKPFLVNGATVAGKVRSNYYAIPHRRWQDTGFSSIAVVHTALSVGVAVYRDREIRQQEKS